MCCGACEVKLLVASAVLLIVNFAYMEDKKIKLLVGLVVLLIVKFMLWGIKGQVTGWFNSVADSEV